jgi:hypothetical protein
MLWSFLQDGMHADGVSMQIEIPSEHVIPAQYPDTFRQGRDADMALPFSFFRELLLGVLENKEQAVQKLEMRIALDEARRLLQVTEVA